MAFIRHRMPSPAAFGPFGPNAWQAAMCRSVHRTIS